MENGAETREPAEPQVFGGYEILKTIGKGKFAIVYRAKKIGDEQVVALKRIAVDMMNEKAREKCLKEVKLLQSLDHPNIIRYMDSFITDNDLFIVYEWAAAGDLKRQLRKAQERGTGFDERVIWKYFSQICNAMQHMHDKRIMHRDLKPANIFLTLDGTIKVGDLGLSRELSEHTIQAHSKVGTPLYMSPEVLKGEGYDFKSDIWSLGCLLYELAMLKSPFKSEGLNLYSLFQKISNGDFVPITETYSEDLRSLCYKMISTKSEDRPEISWVCKVAQDLRTLTGDKSGRRRTTAATATATATAISAVDAAAAGGGAGATAGSRGGQGTLPTHDVADTKASSYSAGSSNTINHKESAEREQPPPKQQHSDISGSLMNQRDSEAKYVGETKAGQDEMDVGGGNHQATTVTTPAAAPSRPGLIRRDSSFKLEPVNDGTGNDDDDYNEDNNNARERAGDDDVATPSRERYGSRKQTGRRRGLSRNDTTSDTGVGDYGNDDDDDDATVQMGRGKEDFLDTPKDRRSGGGGGGGGGPSGIVALGSDNVRNDGYGNRNNSNEVGSRYGSNNNNGGGSLLQEQPEQQHDRGARAREQDRRNWEDPVAVKPMFEPPAAAIGDNHPSYNSSYNNYSNSYSNNRNTKYTSEEMVTAAKKSEFDSTNQSKQQQQPPPPTTTFYRRNKSDNEANATTPSGGVNASSRKRGAAIAGDALNDAYKGDTADISHAMQITADSTAVATALMNGTGEQFIRSGSASRNSEYRVNGKRLGEHLQPSAVAFAAMDILYAKLIAIGYPLEDPDVKAEFQSRTEISRGRLLPIHFACDLQLFQNIAGHHKGFQFLQFRRMVHVAVWLCKHIGGNAALATDDINAEENTPVMTAKQLLRAAQEVDGSMAAEVNQISPTSLTAGHGINVCHLLTHFVDAALKVHPIRNTLVYRDNVEADDIEGNDDDDDEKEDDGVEDEIEDDKQSMDGEFLGVDGDTTHMLDHSAGLGADMSSRHLGVSTAAMMSGHIDPDLWRVETDRVAPKLAAAKRGVVSLSAGVVGVEWMDHVDALRQYAELSRNDDNNTSNNNKNNNTGPSSVRATAVADLSDTLRVPRKHTASVPLDRLVSDLSFMKKEIDNSLARIHQSELILAKNPSVAAPSTTYSNMKHELSQKEIEVATLNEKLEKLTATLADIQEKYDDLVETLDSKMDGSNTVNGSGGGSSLIVRLKDSIKVLKTDIKNMGRDTVLLNNNLLTHRVQASRSQYESQRAKQRKAQQRREKPSSSSDDILGDDDAYSLD